LEKQQGITAVIDRRFALGINEFSVRKGKILTDDEMVQAWAKHYPNHRADKVSEHVCRLICLCIDYRVSGEISDGDTAAEASARPFRWRVQSNPISDNPPAVMPYAVKFYAYIFIANVLAFV
jgi:hypothetical protein